MTDRWGQACSFLISESEILLCVLAKTNGFRDTKRFCIQNHFPLFGLLRGSLKYLAHPHLAQECSQHPWLWMDNHGLMDVVESKVGGDTGPGDPGGLPISTEMPSPRGWMGIRLSTATGRLGAQGRRLLFCHPLMESNSRPRRADVPSTALCVLNEETGGGNYWMKK